MFHGRKRPGQAALMGLILLMLVGCRVPGRHFGTDGLQLRLARSASMAIQRDDARHEMEPPVELRRTAEVEAILMVGK